MPRKKSPPTPKTEPSKPLIEGPKNRLAEIPWTDQESDESGLVSPEKNEILDEHARQHPEGDPAVRRIHPSRDVIERNYHRLKRTEEGFQEAFPDFFETLRIRHSVRAFLNRPVEDEKIRRILEAANAAPSAGDQQAYEIVMVRDPDRKKALVSAALEQDYIAAAPVVLVFCAHPERSADKYGERGQELYCLQDATIAAAYAQLAATAVGIGSVWVGAFDEKTVAELVGGLRPICILPLGYAAQIPEALPRRSLDDLVHPEKL